MSPTIDDCLKRCNQELFYPPFLAALRATLQDCLDQGCMYVISEGFRTYATSFQLNQKALNGGPRAAPGGQSAHNFGLAADIFRNKKFSPIVMNGDASWADADLQSLWDAAKKHGLLDGRSYKDADHFNWPGFVSAQELRPLHLLFQQSQGSLLERLKIVWALVDKGAVQ